MPSLCQLGKYLGGPSKLLMGRAPARRAGRVGKRHSRGKEFAYEDA